MRAIPLYKGLKMSSSSAAASGRAFSRLRRAAKILSAYYEASQQVWQMHDMTKRGIAPHSVTSSYSLCQLLEPLSKR